MFNADMDWVKYLHSYKKALNRLEEALLYGWERLSELERDGFIHRFSYTYELACTTLQAFLRNKGYTGIAGPNVILQQAFVDGYITDAAGWKKMKGSRRLIPYIYDSNIAQMITQGIANDYYTILDNLNKRLDLVCE